MIDPLKAACGSCGCPGQHIGLPCGWCQVVVSKPGSMRLDGTARVTEVFGYRGWEISGEGESIRLASPIQRTIRWEPGQWLMAECSKYGALRTTVYMTPDPFTPDPTIPGYHGSQAPDKANWSPVKGCGGPTGHGCGFYSARTREHLVGTLGEYVRYSEGRPMVIGKVRLAGKIILATNGFRAQKVRPVEIYVPFECWEIARDLKVVYEPHGVVVKLETTVVLPADGNGAMRWCSKCRAKMNRTAVCGSCGYKHK
jgi:hypothetical protein